MIYTKMTKIALKMCFEAHKNQVDKSGMPYVFHPFHLAEQMQDEDTTTVALLHDIVEDTDYTIDDLRSKGFSEKVIEAIELLTHDPVVPYMEYVAQIKKNPIAKAVKLADLKHNSDMTRLESITAKDEERAEKYRSAIELLVGETSKATHMSAHLVRVKTNEIIPLNKPLFRIGKEKNYVDYFISDNTAVSRAHANFINRDGIYFVVDLNSMNHTYVDGIRIEANKEFEITSNCQIMLANEKFLFEFD